MKRVLAVLGVFSVGAALASAPPVASSPVGRTPEQLVERLGADSFAEREAAQAALAQAGPAAQPALETAIRHANPEISRRAERLLAALNRAADSKQRLTAKPVRLAFRDMPVGMAVNELKKLTGIPLQLDASKVANPLRLVTCEIGDLPPWQAVAAFCKAANLTEVFAAEVDVPKAERRGRGYYVPPSPPPPPEKVPVVLADGPYVDLPGSRSSAVRVLAMPAKFPGHRVYLGSGDVLFHCDVAPLPGLNWREVAGVRITNVVDAEGRRGASGISKDAPFASMLDFGGGIVAVGWGGIGGDFEPSQQRTTYPNPRIVPVPIKVATPAARSLKLLEGSVICELATPNQPLVAVSNVAASIGESFAGPGSLKLSVLEATVEKGIGVFRVQTETQIERVISFMPVAVPGMDIDHRLKAFDAAGKPLRITTSQSSEFTNDGLTFTSVMRYTCASGLPAKLVYYGPKPSFVEVPFKMENVPLP
ncbi:MAG TPA: hypothetical protein VN641_14340 [Urbifossiella sp.]|nr:hypothetical protein [Urbifossiella sp.]